MPRLPKLQRRQEYYPFGLQTASSWTREGSSNNYLYNEGNELNQNSGWYETFFRGYDPALGRFHQVDPLAFASGSQTPYNYAYNDPVFYNDPNGDYPEPTLAEPERPGDWGFWVGAASGGFDSYVSSLYGGSPIPDGGYFGGSSIGNFIHSAMSSQYGGSWSNGSYHFFTEEEAREVANSYYFESYSSVDYSSGGLNGNNSVLPELTIGRRLVQRAQQGGLDDSGVGPYYRWFDYTSEARAAIVTNIPFVIMVTEKGASRPAQRTILVTVMIQLPKSVAISPSNRENREWMNPNEASRLTDASIRTAHMETVMTVRTTDWAGLESRITNTFTSYLENQLSMRWPGIDLPGVPGARVISRQNIPSQYMGYATPFVP